MATIVRFEDLDAWKIARELTREVYRITSVDRFSRDFGLKDQIRKASVSIMSNVAEGFERDGNREFCNFLSVGKGSAGEVQSQLYVGLDQDYITRDDFEFIYSKAKESGRVIAGLGNYLKQSGFSGLKFRRYERF
jgi:four helix bundle protein